MQEGADDAHLGLSKVAECRQQPAEIGALTSPVQHRLPVNTIEIHHGDPIVLRVADQVLQLQVPVAQTVSVQPSDRRPQAVGSPNHVRSAQRTAGHLFGQGWPRETSHCQSMSKGSRRGSGPSTDDLIFW